MISVVVTYLFTDGIPATIGEFRLCQYKCDVRLQFQLQVWSRNKDKKERTEHKRGCKTTNTSRARSDRACFTTSLAFYITAHRNGDFVMVMVMV